MKATWLKTPVRIIGLSLGVTVLSLAFSGALRDPAPRRQSLELSECRFAAFDRLAGSRPNQEMDPALGEAKCGRYEVWEDRSNPSGRRISLNVIVLPSTGDDPAPDPLFLFAGGPGSAVSTWGWVPTAFAEIRTRRDIVLVDHRGSGESYPLACEPLGDDENLQRYLDPMLDPDYVADCRRRLEQKADLRFYNTPSHTADIDEIRAALGYDRINLWGVSGGTRAVLVYLRRHPDQVRAAAMEGIVPTDFKYPLPHAKAGQQALDRVLWACAADPACVETVGDPEADLERVMELFSGGPVAVHIKHPERDEEVELSLHRDVAAERIRSLMYSAHNAVGLPGILDRAATSSDLGEIASLVLDYQRGFVEGENWFTGLWMSITCTEDVAFITDQEAHSATAGTLFGDYRVRTHREACKLWPRGALPQGYHRPVVSEAPVLIISGTLDPVTPPVFGDQVARHLINAKHVIVRQGHGPTDAVCADRVLADFIERGSTRGLDVGCLEAVHLPSWNH